MGFNASLAFGAYLVFAAVFLFVIMFGESEMFQGTIVERIHYWTTEGWCVALGWGLIAATKDADPDDSATTGILSALASGTFLYVSTMELLPDALERARRPGGSRMLTNIAIGIGATAFASLAKWT